MANRDSTIQGQRPSKLGTGNRQSNAGSGKFTGAWNRRKSTTDNSGSNDNQNPMHGKSTTGWGFRNKQTPEIDSDDEEDVETGRQSKASGVSRISTVSKVSRRFRNSRVSMSSAGVGVRLSEYQKQKKSKYKG